MRYWNAEEETLRPPDLAALQRRKLKALLDRIIPSNAFYTEKLEGLKFDPLSDDLARLPFTTRAEIQGDQLAHPPYGRNLTFELEKYVRIHQTSGSAGIPMRWLDTAESWRWFNQCWALIFCAAGVTEKDRVFLPFSFGPFIGFWSAFESATYYIKCFCAPAGGMTSKARLQYLLDNRLTVVCCTPTYALRLAEVARQEGLDLPGSSARALIVAGEPGGSVPAIRRRIESDWGAQVIDHAGMTEMGAWGFQTPDDAGGMYVNEAEFIAEVIDPHTLQAVPDGTPGELVLTNLGRLGSPLIRYRTGDQVRLQRGVEHQGRWFARLDGGILGRIDDMICIRGNNVFPSAIEGILREIAEVVEFRLVVTDGGGLSELTIEVEAQAGVEAAALPGRIGAAVRDRLHFRPQVELVGPGTLPRYEMKARRLVRR
jgi:phenylacetate-CoA ligase